MDSQNKKRDWRETLLGISLPQIIAGVFSILAIFLAVYLNNNDEESYTPHKEIETTIPLNENQQDCYVLSRLKSSIQKIQDKSKSETDPDERMKLGAVRESFQNYLKINDLCDKDSQVILNDIDNLEQQLGL